MTRRRVIVSAVLLIVFAAPRLAAQKEINLENGLDPYGSYQHGNVDSVSMINGNVNVHIPFKSFPQRGKVRLDFSLVWNAKNWSIVQTSHSGGVIGYWNYADGTRVAGMQLVKEQSLYYNFSTTTLSNGIGSQTVTLYGATTPDGSYHAYGQLSSWWNFVPAIDGSGITPSLVGATSVQPTGAYDREGIKYIWAPNAYLRPETEDSNGNKISTSDSGWTDTVGRFIPGGLTDPGVKLSSSSPSNTTPPDLVPGVPTSDLGGCMGGVVAARVWNLPGPQGTTSTYKFCYYDIQYQTSFNYQRPGYSISEGTGTARVLRQIVQPDGTSWVFTYDSYLCLTQIQLPTGGSISYTWSNIAFTPYSEIAPMSRTISQRTVNDETGSHTWTYTWTADPNSPNSGNFTNIVTDPDGNDEVHYIGPGFSDYRTQYFQGGCGCQGRPQGTLLKTVDTDNVGLGTTAFNYGPTNPVGRLAPGAVTTIWPNGKVSRVVYIYDAADQTPLYDFNDPNFISYGNQPRTFPANYILFGNRTKVSEYDYAANTPGVVDSQSVTPGPLSRVTTTVYKWTDAADTAGNYKASNLVDLPLNTTVTDGAGNICAKTKFGYDETGLQGSGLGTPQQLYPPPGPVRGNKTTVSQWLSQSPCTSASESGGTYLSATNTYYDSGMVQQSNDFGQHATKFTYSGFNGAYVTRTDMPTTHSPNTTVHYVSGNYDFSTGLLNNFTDQNGQATTYTYDNMFRLIDAVFPDIDTQGDHAETKYTWHDALTLEMQKRIDAGRWTDFYLQFDGLGRESRRATLNDQGGWDQVDTCYDNLGRKHFVSYAYQSNGFAAPKRCSNSAQTPGDTFAYDALGRMLSVTHSDGNVLSTNYAGPATQVIDEGTVSPGGAINVQRISQVDGLGRLTRVCEVSGQALSVGSGATPQNCGTDVTGTGFVTTYSYDTLGNLTGVSQGGYLPRGFTYDSLSRLITANNPESGTTCYGQSSGSDCINGYDADGNLIYRTRPSPNPVHTSPTTTTTYSYDEMHRLLGKTYSDDTPRVAVEYDDTSVWGITATNPIGNLSFEGVLSGGTTLSATVFPIRDARGRSMKSWQCTTRVCGTSSYEIDYDYDLLGDIKSSTNGVGVNFGYSYNAAGRLTSMTSNASQGPGTLLSHVTYGPFGITSALFGNGWGENRNYSQRGWLQSRQDGPATVNNPTPSMATISISDTLNYYWQQTQWATYGSATIYIQGFEYYEQQTEVGCVPYTDPYTYYDCEVNWDRGTIWVGANGYNPSIGWGGPPSIYDTWNIAWWFRNFFNSHPESPVSASGTNDQIILTSKQIGSAGNYPLYLDSISNVFGSPSFYPWSETTTLAGGQDDHWDPVYDFGTTNVSVAGYSHNWPWSGSGTTAASIASNLAAIIERDNPYVHASAGGNTITLTSRTPGASGNNYSFTSGTSSNQGSFPTSPSSGTMTPGTDFSLSINSPVYSFNLGFTGNGDIQTANDSVNGNWSYTYDQFNRLSNAVAANISKGCSETYDRFGNRWDQQPYGGTGYSCNPFVASFTGNNNRIDGYSYDAAGNLLNDGNHRYAYDAENRIKCVDPDPTTWSCNSAMMVYTYDAEGHRVRASNPAGTSGLEYLYDLQGHAVTALNASNGGWNRGEIYADGQHIATYANGTTYFNHSDWLGTERLRSQMNGTEYSRWTNLPFGEGSITPDPSPLHFTGKERDAEDGLDYFGARYYSSGQGRWMSPDWAARPTAVPYAVFGDPQSLNLYGYVRNSPIGRFDTDGHSFDCSGEKAQGAGCQFLAWVHSFDASWNQAQNQIQRAGGAVGRWVGMEYATALQEERAEAAARAKMTANDYVDEWMFAVMLGKDGGEMRLTESMSKTALRKLTEDIAKNGLKDNVISYVEIGGEKYVVNGNNRLMVARRLGMTDQLKFQEVKLPLAGFKTEADVINAHAELLEKR
jgi:RHS repeat-associated protein